jgi:hypothetical protein
MNSDAEQPTPDTSTYELLTGIYEWRLQHPEATLTEIETALDERWYRVRAQMLQDLALRSSAATWHASTAAPPACPDCGGRLVRRGRQPRTRKTHGGQDLTLTRSYGYCPKCKKGHFPPR